MIYPLFTFVYATQTHVKNWDLWWPFTFVTVKRRVFSTWDLRVSNLHSSRISMGISKTLYKPCKCQSRPKGQESLLFTIPSLLWLRRARAIDKGVRKCCSRKVTFSATDSQDLPTIFDDYIYRYSVSRPSTNVTKLGFQVINGMHT